MTLTCTNCGTTYASNPTTTFSDGQGGYLTSTKVGCKNCGCGSEALK